MRNLFPGHFKHSEETVKEDWNSFEFILDTSILLNIYRYSDSTQKEFLGLLDKIKDRAWLPYRVVEEYLDNRLKVIGEQEGSYDKILSDIESLKQKLHNNRQHPFASKSAMDTIENAFEKLSNEFNTNKEIYTKRVNDDDIKNQFLSMYNEKVGVNFPQEQLVAIFSEGESRYEALVPPGYKDAKKGGREGSVESSLNKYGDLIIWKEIIKRSTETENGIIFITDDKKEDWWQIFNGKTLGPRPELIKEFEDITKNRIHIYQADRFLELARTNLGEEVSHKIVDEIREALKNTSSKEDLLYLERNNKNKYDEENEAETVKRINLINRELESLTYKLSQLKSARELAISNRQGIEEVLNKSINEQVFNSDTERDEWIKRANDIKLNLAGDDQMKYQTEEELIMHKISHLKNLKNRLESNILIIRP
ncbi:DUF4935 domain-containing protein [Cobetia sp. 4B]|uniref:PIN-like domain-containing protein n=1 Tax=Cobetia sp. 4B TaxID=2758724 RepID=UPI001C0507BF|nr:PIN-like domain-containing protein [Cobetia sp. 4B]MBR9753229.1 DUF4935 domain-containing protein [Gammaproteobacteria bacterium]QWN37989.1 DUF4935 domain-containing protein [Cobetia sp. 4B]